MNNVECDRSERAHSKIGIWNYKTQSNIWDFLLHIDLYVSFFLSISKVNAVCTQLNLSFAG